MQCIPVNTNGLCEALQRGDKFQIRKEVDDASHFFENGAEVEIVDFSEDQPPQCKNSKARLLEFKDKGMSQWHPMWIINCSECPFYDTHWVLKKV